MVKRRKTSVERAEQQLQRAQDALQTMLDHREQILAAADELREQLPQEETYTMNFTVTGPLPELKALKAYILTRNLTIEEDEHEQ